MRLGNGFIAPTSNSTTIEDATTDLGLSGYRFKDLYLSGGVYLGGTGAANKLEDYEEGTWTPTVIRLATAPSVTYGIQNGTYTKVGRLVTVTFDCRFSALTGGSGTFVLAGLPFTSINSASSGSMAEHTSGFQYPSGRTYATFETSGGTSFLYILCSGTAVSTSSGINISDHNGYIIGSITYETSA